MAVTEVDQETKECLQRPNNKYSRIDYSGSHDFLKRKKKKKTQPVTMLHFCICICSPARVQTGKFDGLNVFAATVAVKLRQGVTVAAEVQVCGG